MIETAVSEYFCFHLSILRIESGGPPLRFRGHLKLDGVASRIILEWVSVRGTSARTVWVIRGHHPCGLIAVRTRFFGSAPICVHNDSLVQQPVPPVLRDRLFAGSS